MADNITAAQKLQALRQELTREGVNGFIIPRADEYQGEYLPPSTQRLGWATGFTGSYGGAVVLDDKAVVMSDGRYVEQMKYQVDPACYETAQMRTPANITPESWISANARPGMKIGYDPRLHTIEEVEGLENALRGRDISLVPLAANPVDKIWTDRPAAPMSPAEIFPERIAGRSAAEKRELVAKAIEARKGHAFILAKADSIAWMLNIRGADVPHTPVALSQAVIYANGDVDWFIESRKITPEVRQALGNHVRVREPAEMAEALADLARAAKDAKRPVLADKSETPVWFKKQLEDGGAAVAPFGNPVIPLRIIKTPAEQAGIRSAHERDGVAMARFLKWIDDEAPKGGLTETEVVSRLEQFRREEPGFRDTSFSTIAGWNGNGAIIHYNPLEPTIKTDKAIKGSGILLVDSGGQYRDGTTDITRTVAVGEVTDEMKTDSTLVLRGHIAVATYVFPEGTVGAAADAMARRALGQTHGSYDHGTGHDVDCCLSVHGTGSVLNSKGMREFKAGMLVSNEPGFYKPDAEGKKGYGIRHENLILVVEKGVRRDKPDEKFLGFETVTLAPFDRRLIKPEMLEDSELEWLNDYHERVYQTLVPHLDHETGEWLRRATLPLKKNPEAGLAVRQAPSAPTP